MKKVALLLLGLSILACKQEEPKEYTSLSGKISNPHESMTLKVFQSNHYLKEITINNDGTFSDTLKLEAGAYMINHGEQYGKIYLAKNNNLRFTTDYTDFTKSLKFEGDGADKSAFYIANAIMTQEVLPNDIMDLNEDEFNKAMELLKEAYANLKSEYKTIDTSFFEEQDKEMDETFSVYNDYYKSKMEMKKALPKGIPSPEFVNYENNDGSKMSLSDLKGKYVYIDVWATWCGPCIAEIPALKEVEKEYHDKNIEFVSISIDTPNAHDKWKQMIKDKELGGVQLLADADWNSKFVTDYKIKGIPRFILIDPNGNIVSADAPRPSSPELKNMLNGLSI